ncbi:hypothetical protein Plhal304r1_c008g0031341 [Plasmopara halstedii]
MLHEQYGQNGFLIGVLTGSLVQYCQMLSCHAHAIPASSQLPTLFSSRDPVVSSMQAPFPC